MHLLYLQPLATFQRNPSDACSPVCRIYWMKHKHNHSSPVTGLHFRRQYAIPEYAALCKLNKQSADKQHAHCLRHVVSSAKIVN